MDSVIISILLVLLGLIVGIVIMFIVNLIRKNSATNKADKILENAKTEAEKIKRDYIAEAKAETNELKLKADEEIKERKQEIKESESRLLTREENIDRRDENLQKRENLLAEKEQNLLDKQNDIQEQEANVEKIREEQLALLEKISGYTKEKARELVMKKVEDSLTEQQYLICPAHINHYGRLFGGQLLKWIDELAGIVAIRHCGATVTTAAIDNLQFQAPAYTGDMIVLQGQVTSVGRTSMEIRVDTYREALDGTREMINRAYIDMVCINCRGIPQEVPDLLIETEEQRLENEAAKKRKQIRKQRRQEGF